MGKKLYIKTYGCQMNEYDSKMTLEVMQSSGDIQEVSTPEDADIILLNTCSIREKAEEKVYSELGRLHKLKQHNPKLKIGVGGALPPKKEKIFLKELLMLTLSMGPKLCREFLSSWKKVTRLKLSMFLFQ